MNNEPLNRLTRYLSIGLAVILAAVIVILAWNTFSSGASSVDQWDREFDDGFSIRTLSDSGDYREVVERNLFSPDRKPKSSTGQQGSNVAGETSETWRLIGLVNTSESTYAIFQDNARQVQRRLEEGMALEGWTIETIDSSHVVVVKDEERKTFRLTIEEAAHSSSVEPRIDSQENENQKSENNE